MLPLEGIKIVDLTRILSGPFATMRLADMGAEVIKIENPPEGDDTRSWGPPFKNGVSSYFLSINRNKKSLTLNLKSGEGRGILNRLIADGDVIIENFRPGLLAKLGYPYSEISRLNSKIIYCSISGYGAIGRRNREPSFDLVVQGESGLMDLTGFPDSPPTKVGISIADVVAGLNAVEGVLLALIKRGKTGVGSWVDISLFDSILAMFTYQLQNFQMSGTLSKRKGNQHPSIAPYETFRGRDEFFNLAVGNDSLFEKMCHSMDFPDLLADPRFKTNADRVHHRAALIGLLAERFERENSTYWMEKFRKGGVPAGPLNNVSQALRELATMERGMVDSYSHSEAGQVDFLHHPVMFADATGTFRRPSTRPAPKVGEHNPEILQRLGFSAADCVSLQKMGVI